MSSMLRLAARDRSSVLLRKLGLHSGAGDGNDGNDDDDETSVKACSVLDDGPLPAISPIDTDSFADFFDQFQGFQSTSKESHVSPPTASSTQSLSQADSDGRATLETSTVAVARNDSTGSSSTISTRSNHLSPVTARSSASSFTEPPSPGLTRTTSAISQNLNKPLPAIKTSGSTDSLHQYRAELDCTQDTTQTRYRPASQCQRSMSLPRGAAELGSVDAARGANSPLPTGELDSRPKSQVRRAPEPDAGPRSKSTRTASGKSQATGCMSASAAESIIYRIMYHLTDVRDLQSAALVSKGFMNTFKRNESTLVSHLMYQTSKPAWELRRNILLLRRMKDFQLQEYVLDLQTINGLKALILDRCRSSLHPKAVAGLSGQDAESEAEVENGLWRIWSFCVLFGEQSYEPLAGLQWLNRKTALGGEGARMSGSSSSGGKGLSPDELENMMGMWNCLQSLVSQFQACRQDAADRAGVFDNWYPELGWTREEHLLEWTAYLLTLGPHMVFAFCSVGGFDRARSLGLTKNWPLPPPGQTRYNFLVAAIAQLRRGGALTKAARSERTWWHAPSAAAASASGLSPGLSVSAPGGRGKSIIQNLSSSASIPHARTLPAEMQNRRSSAPRPVSVAGLPTTAAPLEIRPDCDPAFASLQPPRNRSSSTLFPAAPSHDPTMLHTLTAITTTASAKLGPTLFPVNYAGGQRRRHGSSSRAAWRRHQRHPTLEEVEDEDEDEADVVDPVDQHMRLLVHQLGFSEAGSKRALAMSDSGSGTDLLRAIEILLIELRQRQRREQQQAAAATANTPVELPTPATPNPSVVVSDVDEEVNAETTSAPSEAAVREEQAHEDQATMTPPVLEKLEAVQSLPSSMSSASTSSSAAMPRFASMRCIVPGRRWRVLGRGNSVKRHAPLAR